MRQKLAALVLEMHTTRIDTLAVLERISAMFRAGVLMQRPGETTAHTALGVGWTVESVEALAGPVILKLSATPRAPQGLWRKLATQSRLSRRTSDQPLFLAVGRSGSLRSAACTLILTRNSAFSAIEADAVGELAFHLSQRVTSVPLPGGQPERLVGPLPSMLMRDGVVVQVSERMRELLTLLEQPHRAHERLLEQARTAASSGPARITLATVDGPGIAFVLMPVSPAITPQRSSPSHDVYVFGYPIEERLEVPIELLRALHPITRQQAEVAQALINGLTAAETAEFLGIAANTVRTHVTALFRSVGVKTRAQLARAMLQEVIAARALAGSGLRVDLGARRRAMG